MYNSQSHAALSSDHAPASKHARKSSRSNSISSASVVTVTRSASLKDNGPDPAKPHKKPTPPSSSRRSSVAHVAVESIGGLREGIGNLNRWSQSTTSSKSSAKEKGHSHQGSFSRRFSISNSPSFTSLHGSTAQQGSQSRSTSSPPRRPSSKYSPASSPNRRPRPRSPAYNPLSSVTTLPQIPSLPLLPSTVYDPNATHSANSSAPNTPDTSALFTPNTFTTNSSTDYFSSKPPSNTASSQQSTARGRPGKSPLASPPIFESEGKYPTLSTGSRPSTSNRTSTANARDVSQRQPQPTIRDRRAAVKDNESAHPSRSQSEASNRLEEGSETPPRNRERREKDKKTMLSRALQKANTAVLLDNAQNFEGAVEAYSDACRLLQQVMIRSSGEEDRKKLDAIRVTYTNRIEELKRLDPGYQMASGKSLPARPMSNESLDGARSIFSAVADNDEQPAVIETATVTRIVDNRPVDEPESPPRQALPLRSDQTGGMRESVITTAIRDVEMTMPNSARFLLQAPPGKLGSSTPTFERSGLESPMDRSYMPPPLSPRRAISPISQGQMFPSEQPSAQNNLLQPAPDPATKHSRGNSNESISWLDTIDESGGSSCSSSVHSLSPRGLRRKHLRTGSGGTEAEFDAALDAAVEAAYDDGLEPYEDDELPIQNDMIATKLRNVELAKERVREIEREEQIAAAKYRYQDRLRNEALPHVRESTEFNLQAEAEEEEERMLDEMTREYMLEGFDFDLQSKSALPRQSDSSTFSGSTYNSSVSSHRTTGGTSLSTVAEMVPPPGTAPQKPPAHSPPPVPHSASLPGISEMAPPFQKAPVVVGPPSSTMHQPSGVRSRRLSGQNPKMLKIETALPAVPPPPHTDKPSGLMDKGHIPDIPPIPKSAGAPLNGSQPSIDPTFKVPGLPASQVQPSFSLAAPSPIQLVPSPADTAFTISPATSALTQVISNDSTLIPSSPKLGKPPGAAIRKNKSSLSLKQRTLSMSSPDGSDASIGTPLSTTFSFTNRKQSNAAQTVPTPSVPTFNVDGLPTGGMHLFESDIHSPYSPGSPNALAVNAPIPLEPCPDSYLLRPFWLMRCFYQTIAHPRGGYLSTKLFVPRDVWRVKGVKLKNVDDKIANCDLLTAALQKLAAVDTFDADAVLEEMQALEVMLDQVQAQLSKKLGNDVGVHGISTLFKEATTVGSGVATGDGSNEKGSHGSQDHGKSAVSQGKSYLASWRKLRSKNSAVGLSNMAGGKIVGTEVPKDALTMATLPMTSLPNIRFAKRDISNVSFEGPNAGYMGSLARLFDAAQILDQVARQVEDPGLKHTSPTHVGLELSARHAAEFFGFYVCRFVLTDVTMMLDKFIKRGSEWVLV